jgi:CspA family cold shock protein
VPVAALLPRPHLLFSDRLSGHARNHLLLLEQAMTMDTVRLTGKIKWINEAKGMGLITPDRGGKDLFASVPVRRGNDRPGELRLKQQVSYQVKLGPDGEEAFDVKAVKG